MSITVASFVIGIEAVGAKFLNGRTQSTFQVGPTSNVLFRGRKGPKASMHAVIDEPIVETLKTKQQKSLYDVLNVKCNATSYEIKSAYRSLAKRYHPDAASCHMDDTNDGCEFIDIHNAYVTLSDATTRALYDMKISRGIERRSGGLYSNSGFGVGRRWETDQCW